MRRIAMPPIPWRTKKSYSALRSDGLLKAVRLVADVVGVRSAAHAIARDLFVVLSDSFHSGQRGHRYQHLQRHSKVAAGFLDRGGIGHHVVRKKIS
jgi:hypothetical protein